MHGLNWSFILRSQHRILPVKSYLLCHPIHTFVQMLKMTLPCHLLIYPHFYAVKVSLVMAELLFLVVRFFSGCHNIFS